MRIRSLAIHVVLLLAGCGEPTELSYQEQVQRFREDYGPFTECGSESAWCEATGPGPAAACLANGISSCSQVEHTLFDIDDDGESATTFVVSVDGGCEIVVMRRLGRGAFGADYRRERCGSVEFNANEPCVHHRNCDVEMRWDHR